jgi:hypothetical protein
MSKTHPLSTTATSAGNRWHETIQDGIHDGEGDQMWNGVKDFRLRHGNTGVLCSALRFTTATDAEAYASTGTFPDYWENVPLDYIPLDEVTEWAATQGITIDPEFQHRLLSASEWLNPDNLIGSVIAVLIAEDEGMAVVLPRLLKWWDREAEVIPNPVIDSAYVDAFLDEHYPASKMVRQLLMLSTRNPDHAGPNLNLWIEACERRGISAIVQAESASALEHLTPENRAAVMTFPVEAK